MLSSSIPSKFGIAFASGASGGFISSIPEGSQPGGRASLTDGFPPETFQPIASGGIPPWGKDMNGLMNLVTKWLQWSSAGGPVPYDATFATKIGGYPKGAMLQKSSTMDRYWISTAENNATNPDTGGANWIPFPDVVVQQQRGNYKIDVGGVNAFEVTLDPLPADLASIVGSPIRVRAANANTDQTPTILIHNTAGDPAVPIINGNGSSLLVGQIARAGQIFEGFLDGLGFFQLAWPPPLVSSPGQQLWAPGQIIIWPTETAPLGTIECDGRSLVISSYPNLFNVIGRTYGGDASHFNIPDLRGQFIRGWDHGRGLDKNSGTRANRGDGTTGDHVGTTELDAVSASVINGPGTLTDLVGTYAGGAPQFPPIIPTPLGGPFSPDPTASTGIGLLGWTTQPNSLSGHGVGNGDGTGAPSLNPYVLKSISATFGFPNAGLETRPVNINMMYCIAY